MNPPTTAFMLADNSSTDTLQHFWVVWQDIGESPPLAVVAAEDQKFAGHLGFDVESIRDSVEEYEDGGALRGASTISQQLAKNLFLWRGRSFFRKGVEAYLTVLIEVSLPKKRILEIYLNVVEFGPGIYGIGAASDVYFGSTPIELRDEDAALLAAVLPNPNRLHVQAPSDYVRERQAWVMAQMQRLRREQWLSVLD